MYDIKTFLDGLFQDFKMDKETGNKIHFARYFWENRSEEHIMFLSSPYLGINRVGFGRDDRDILLREIFGIDVEDLQKQLFKVKGVNKSFKISSDVTNITTMYLIHRFAISKDIKEVEKQEVIKSLFRIFCYRNIGSMYSHYFGKFTNDLKHVHTVFEKMSNKFLLKRFGNFSNVMDYWVDTSLPMKGNMSKKIINFNNKEVVDVINDMYNKIKDVIKSFCKLYYEYIDSDEDAIQRDSMKAKGEEGEILKDINSGYYGYVDKVNYLLNNPGEFIDEDLIYLIGKKVPNCNIGKLKDALIWICENERFRDGKEIDWITVSIRESLSYLRRSPKMKMVIGYEKNIVACFNALLGFFTASRVNIEDLEKSKVYLRKTLGKNLRMTSKNIVGPVSIAIMIYIFIRSIK